MPSSEDMIDRENEARELAVNKIVQTENCSRDLAKKYVSRLNKSEIAKLIGWPEPGQPYSAW